MKFSCAKVDNYISSFAIDFLYTCYVIRLLHDVVPVTAALRSQRYVVKA